MYSYKSRTKYQLLTDELNDINEELNRYGGIDINDTVVKTRFDLIRNELKKFEDADFEVTGELLHSFVNKILVEESFWFLPTFAYTKSFNTLYYL